MATHAHTTPTPTVRRTRPRPAAATPATIPSPLNERLIRAQLPVELIFNHPDETGTIQERRGILVAGMLVRGEVHNYRIRDTDGAIWIIPSRWMTPKSLVIAGAAGVQPMQRSEEARCKLESSLFISARLQAILERLEGRRAQCTGAGA